LKVFRTDFFKQDLQRLPAEIQNRAEKAIRLLAETPRHPSLRAKKLKGLEDIWEASVSMSYRITYQTAGDTLTLRRIGTHDILKKEGG
jgi:mRNA interferase RelE/StbE